METNIKTILEKNVLPISDDWKLSRLEINEEKLEVRIYLFYEPKKYKISYLQYELYDDNLKGKSLCDNTNVHLLQFT